VDARAREYHKGFEVATPHRRCWAVSAAARRSAAATGSYSLQL